MNVFAKYWWLFWGLGATCALVIFRMRRRGGPESIPRRIMYALFPYADPVRSSQRQLSSHAAAFIGGGVLLFTLAYLLFLQSH
jgi:hypothetical protein